MPSGTPLKQLHLIDQVIAQLFRIRVMRRHANLWNQVQQRVGGDCQCISAAENLRQVCRDLWLADGGRCLLRRRPWGGRPCRQARRRRRREDCKGIQIAGLSCANRPELKLQTGPVAGDVHRETAGALKATPELTGGVQLEIVVARVVRDLPRRHRQRPQTDTGQNAD